MRITVITGVLALALAGAACSSAGGTATAPSTSAPAEAPTATTEPSQADEVRTAAVEEDFPYELSSQDGDIDAAGKAVCDIKGEADPSDYSTIEDATAAYGVVLDAVEDEGKDGMPIRKDGTDDSITIYTILYDDYCPGKK